MTLYRHCWREDNSSSQIFSQDCFFSLGWDGMEEELKSVIHFIAAIAAIEKISYASCFGVTLK